MQIRPQVIEENGLEIAFGCAGEDGDDDFACILRFSGFQESSPGSGSAGDTHGKPFEFHEADRGSDGIGISNRNDAINEVDAESIRNEARAETFDAMRTGTTTGENRAGARFDGHDFEGGFASAQAFGNSGEGPAGADSDDDHINGTICILPDFLGSPFAMGTRVSRIVELLR